jgi:2,4-dienoyl-CoA reductase-like NADH-dependent reductase (Old Yellow Enzyme family)/thioredoxin reductase
MHSINGQTNERDESSSISRRTFVAGGACVAGIAAAGIAGVGVAQAASAKTGTSATKDGTAASARIDATAPANSDASLIASATMNPQDYTAYRTNSKQLTELFSPWQFGGLTIRNRMVKSAAGSDTGKNPVECVAYYRNFAAGGVDMVWVEDFVDKYAHFPMSRGVPIADAPLADLADAVHAEGGHIGYQISCMGIPFSGTAQTAEGKFASAVAGDMTQDEIHTIIQDAADFAAQLKDLGWDAVEINAAGNNIGQSFFSRMRNKRDDEYGPQSFENRSRFVCEMIQAIKAQCGDAFPVQVLLNGIEENDTNLGDSTLMTTVEENCEMAKYLEAAGADALHVRLGPLGMHVCQFASDLYFTGYGINGTTAYGTQFDFRRHWQGKLRADHGGAGMMLSVAREFKDAVTIPVGAVTYMDPAHAPDYFEGALQEGDCDFYLMNRPLTVDPQYVNKLQAGKLDEIAPCTRCMHCHFDYDLNGNVYEHCRVNATTQRAFREAMPEGFELPPLTGAPKKVMVVGGGPAGMEAARIAALRGHDVTLCEKSGMLGGLLPFASAVKGPHENLDDLIAYLQRQLDLAGVTVRLDTEVTAETVAKEAPDALVLACGGTRAELDVTGTSATPIVPIDQVMFAGLEGKDVTIAGSNAQAVDCALWLQAHGANVTMVTPDPLAIVDKGQSAWVKTFVMPMLYARGMRVWPNARIATIGDGTVTISGDAGCDITIACDAVLNASDMLPNTALLDEVDVAEAYAVGDCSSPFNIAEAIAAGNLTARKL